MTVDTHRLRTLLEAAGLDHAAARQRAEQIALLEAHGEPLDAQAREMLAKLERRFGSAETAAIPQAPPGTEATMASPDLAAAALAVDTTWKGEPRTALPEAPVETLPPPGRAPAAGRSSPSIEPGERVDQYEIIRPIGKGGMGAVYLARDVLLGRKVALKVVHPNLLATAGAVDRFLFEARATASFNHPNIVTIYGLGQVHGCPYVALEYLPGNSLRERLREGPLAAGEVVAMGRRVAEALAEAHRQGLLHCDLKPENVFLPRDGRLRVLDFGLARLVARAPVIGAPDPSTGDEDERAADGPGSGSGQRTGLRGTAAYMAPEQWRQAELTPAVDLWALGVTLFEMLTGERPFSGSLVALYEQVTSPEVPVPSVADRRSGLPGVLVDLCARCLRREPGDRPTAAEVADALARMSGGAARLPASEAECPYRGLQPFRRAHAELFFGRTEETAAFIERLREAALLAVVGPSGAGKSSFIQAGVLPRLESLGSWESLVLRPGAAPFAALASRLLRSPTLATDSAPAFPDGDRRQADAELTLADQLRAEPALLGRQLRLRAAERGTRILVLVDQLEEIFTLTADAATRQAFAQALLFAADDPVGPVKIVLTLRDDFLGRLAEFDALVAEVSRGIVVIRTPGAEALAETLTEPAARVGYRFEDERLVPEMVAEVASEPAGLPLLQFAAERLWEGRDRTTRVLRRATYEAIGGVAGALAEHADRVLAGLVGEASGAAREVLLRLVTPEGTRASVKDTELVEQVGPGAAEAIEHLVAARLVVSRRSLAEGHATTELELVHESLITRWERLRRWREESRDEVALEKDLRAASTQWHRRGQRDEDLWRGLSLAEAIDWRDRRRAPLADDLAQFIDRSAREAQHQASRLARLRVGLIGGVLLVALSIGAFFWVRAKEQRTAAAKEVAVHAQAEARHQLGQALIEGAAAARLRGDLAEARAKLRAAFEVEDSVSARALYAELLKDPLLFRVSEPAAVISVAVAPDGKTVATGSYDGTIRLWDWMTGSARVLRGHQKEVFSLAFAPDGRFLLSGSGDGDARLWTLASGEARVLRSHLERVHAVAVAPDGQTVATATSDGLITLIPLAGQEVRTLRGHTGRVTALEFAPDGQRLASAGDDRVIRIWTLATGAVRRLEGHTDGVLVVAFGPRGGRLASASEDQTVRVWDLDTGRVRVLEGHRGGVTALAFHPRRPWVASGGSDTTVRVWDLDTGAERVLPKHRDRVTGLSWGSVDDLLATCSYDREVRVLGLGTPEPPPPRGHTDWVSGVTFSPDGRTIASASQDRTIRLWDVATGRSRPLRGHTARVMTVAYRADGQVLASTGWDGTVRLWTLATGQVRVLRGHQERVYGLAFAPAGDQIASGGWDREIRIWDLATGTSRILRGHTDRIFSLAYAPDGKTLASGAWDGTIRLWDPVTGKARVLAGHQNRVTGIAYAPSGSFLVSGSYDRTVRIWDPATGTSRSLQGHGDFIWGVAVSPDSRLIASASRDEQIRLWDVASGRLLRTIHGHTRDANRVAFSPAGDLLVSTGDDSTVRLWALPSGRPRWRAPLLEAGPGLRLVTGRGALDATALEAADPALARPRDADDRRLLAEIVENARRAEPSADGSRVAQVSWDGRVTLWGTRPALRFWGSDAGGADQAAPFGTGVAVLAGGAVTLVAVPGGARQPLVTEGATFLEVAGRELLVATPREVRRFDGQGRLLGRHRVDVGVTAATVRPPDLVVGHRDGLFELQPLAGGPRPDRPFEDTPAHPVTRLLAGPAGTLAAGFRDGTVGLWNVQTGKLLERRTLHGPVAHLRLVGSLLHAASELGDAASLDLGVFHRQRCALMRLIWRRFPGTWEAGLAVRRAAPKEHECSGAARPAPTR